METLIEIMHKVLAESYAFQLKSHNYHWNVEGSNFPQYHDFLSELYTEVHTAVDIIAEQIRTLDSYAPGSFTKFKELSEIECEMNIPLANEMMIKLTSDNQTLLNTLTMAMKLAENFDKPGLADFLAGRIDTHNKHAWMLRSITK